MYGTLQKSSAAEDTPYDSYMTPILPARVPRSDTVFGRVTSEETRMNGDWQEQSSTERKPYDS